MLDVLKALSDTSVPSLLMGLGGLLLLLAFVQRIGTQIELPPSRQKAAAMTGIFLLIIGSLLTVASPLVEIGSQLMDPVDGTSPGEIVIDQNGPPPGQIPGTPPAAVAANLSAAGLLPSESEMEAMLPGLDGTFERSTTTIHDALSDWPDETQATMGAMLEKGGFRGELIEAYQDDAEGEVCADAPARDDIQGYLVSVEALDDPQVAVGYWNGLRAKLEAESDELVELSDREILDEWEEDCASGTQLVHDRHRIDGNLVMLVRFYAYGHQVGDPAVLARSGAILDGIAAKSGIR